MPKSWRIEPEDDPFMTIEVTMRVSDWENLLTSKDIKDEPIEHTVRNAIIEYHREQDLERR